MYVLIIVMLMSGRGTMITTQEFSNISTCEMAARIVRDLQTKSGNPAYDTAVCVIK